MSAKLDVLTEGYATLLDDPSEGGKFMKAVGSCCLVRAGQTLLLFDTMGPWERDSLLEKLSKLKVHPDDINHLVCSHSHPDHIGNLNLFTKAKKHFVGTSVYSSDIYDLNCFEPVGSYSFKSKKRPDAAEIEVIQYQDYQINNDLTIQPTPGHTLECISLLVTNCHFYGSVALAGDLFENGDDVLDEGIWLGAGSQNPDLQRASRSRIYNQVDHILPGHGPMFKTQRPSEF